MMLWQLVQPVERGGLGMAPSEAKRLTIDEAEFYLMDEKDVRRGDKEIRQRLGERDVLHEPKPLTAEEIMKQRRKHFMPSGPPKN